MRPKRQFQIGFIATALLFGCKNDPKEVTEPVKNEIEVTKQATKADEIPQISTSVMARLMTVPELATMGRMSITAGLADALTKEGPYTVFAPSNDAFEGIDQAVLQTLLDPRNKELLVDLLRNHIVATELGSDQLLQQLKGGPVDFKTMGGAVMVVHMEDDDILLTDPSGAVSVVSKTDIHAQNGTVHVLNAVLNLPEQD